MRVVVSCTAFKTRQGHGRKVGFLNFESMTLLTGVKAIGVLFAIRVGIGRVVSITASSSSGPASLA